MNDLGMQDIYTLQIKRHKRSSDISSPNCEACQKGFLHVNSLQVREFTQTGKLAGVCKACNATFLKICRLQIRNLNQTDRHSHVCETCGKAFTHAGNFLKHKRNHENDQNGEAKVAPEIKPCAQTASAIPKPTPPFKCEKCGKIFSKHGPYVNHVEGHENGENLTCPICEKVCSTKVTFKKHVERCESRQAVYVCHYCENTFSTKSSLKTHLEMHTVPQETHICKFCKESFVVPEELEQHLLQHLNEQQIKEEPAEETVKFNHFCVECKKGFIHLGPLRKHMQTHSNSTNLPYQCKTCKKQFVLASRLKKHMKLHIQQWPYSCNLCNKHFKNLKSLKKHKTSHKK